MSRKKTPVDDLPLLTEVVDEDTGRFPTLTEVVGEAIDDSPVQGELIATQPATPTSPADITPQLLPYLEKHLENAFAQKLAQKLAEAQQHAIAQTIAELKSELPQLIRDALDKPALPASQQIRRSPLHT